MWGCGWWWAEGPREAEALLRDVQRALLEKQMGYDAALVSLDLAILYAQEGRTKRERVGRGDLKRPGSLSPKAGRTSLKLGNPSPK
jgi:hypothetical protein